MNYIYDFNIADLLIRVESPYRLYDLHELTPFLTELWSEYPADVTYTIAPFPKDWAVRGNKLADLTHSRIYQYKSELHRYYFWNLCSEDRFILTTCPLSGENRYTIYLQKETLDRILPQFRLAAFLFPERMLLEHGGYLLHASMINDHGQGILFTGPSGIGKSTQAELWVQTEGAELLNGDRAILRREGPCWLTYGSPYAGTSGVYRNSRVPLRAIVVLSQGPENTLCRLTQRKAFMQLLPQVAAMPWCADSMAKLSDLLLDTISSVPVYHLSCLPNPNAVALLKHELLSLTS